MARPGPETQAKRRREQEKREKRMAKEEKKALRKALKNAPPVDETTVDPAAQDSDAPPVDAAE